MSREAVNQIIDRAVGDESFFELLRTKPDQAIQGYELDVSETSALKSGAYDVVVRARRKDRGEQSAREAARTAPAAAAAPAAQQPVASAPAQPPVRGAVAGLAGFLIVLVLVGGGIGAFRYFETQWPWQALGFGRAAAPASIPAPSLGSRAKPASSAGPSAASSAGAKPAPSAAASGGVPAAASAQPSGQAQLRPSSGASAPASAVASGAANPQRTAADKAYFQSVGARLSTVLRSFAATVADLRAGNDPGKNLNDLASAVTDSRQHLDDAPPPDQLKQQHAALAQALPLLQGNVDQLKGAIEQKNGIQAILIAAQIDALLNQLPDEVAFATTPHPELYQPIDSSQQLSHIQNFDVISQNVTSRNYAPAAVVLRIGVQSANPSNDEIADTLRHSVVAARQTYPQAGQVRVVALKEVNGTTGSQLGTADWYCSPDARPPDGGSSNWQDTCGKIYVSISGASPTTVPY
jgi:hypothetical protein